MILYTYIVINIIKTYKYIVINNYNIIKIYLLIYLLTYILVCIARAKQMHTLA